MMLVNMNINVPLLFVVVFVWLAEGFEATETCSCSSSSSVVKSNATAAAVAALVSGVVVFGVPAGSRPSVHDVQDGVGHGAVQALPEGLERGRQSDLLVPPARLARGRNHNLDNGRQAARQQQEENISDKMT